MEWHFRHTWYSRVTQVLLAAVLAPTPPSPRLTSKVVGSVAKAAPPYTGCTP